MLTPSSSRSSSQSSSPRKTYTLDPHHHFDSQILGTNADDNDLLTLALREVDAPDLPQETKKHRLLKRGQNVHGQLPPPAFSHDHDRPSANDAVPNNAHHNIVLGNRNKYLAFGLWAALQELRAAMNGFGAATGTTTTSLDAAGAIAGVNLALSIFDTHRARKDYVRAKEDYTKMGDALHEEVRALQELMDGRTAVLNEKKQRLAGPASASSENDEKTAELLRLYDALLGLRMFSLAVLAELMGSFESLFLRACDARNHHEARQTVYDYLSDRLALVRSPGIDDEACSALQAREPQFVAALAITTSTGILQSGHYADNFLDEKAKAIRLELDEARQQLKHVGTAMQALRDKRQDTGDEYRALDKERQALSEKCDALEVELHEFEQRLDSAGSISGSVLNPFGMAHGVIKLTQTIVGSTLKGIVLDTGSTGLAFAQMIMHHMGQVVPGALGLTGTVLGVVGTPFTFSAGIMDVRDAKQDRKKARAAKRKALTALTETVVLSRRHRKFAELQAGTHARGYVVAERAKVQSAWKFWKGVNSATIATAGGITAAGLTFAGLSGGWALIPGGVILGGYLISVGYRFGQAGAAKDSAKARQDAAYLFMQAYGMDGLDALYEGGKTEINPGHLQIASGPALGNAGLFAASRIRKRLDLDQLRENEYLMLEYLARDLYRAAKHGKTRSDAAALMFAVHGSGGDNPKELTAYDCLMHYGSVASEEEFLKAARTEFRLLLSGVVVYPPKQVETVKKLKDDEIASRLQAAVLELYRFAGAHDMRLPGMNGWEAFVDHLNGSGRGGGTVEPGWLDFGRVLIQMKQLLWRKHGVGDAELRQISNQAMLPKKLVDMLISPMSALPEDMRSEPRQPGDTEDDVPQRLPGVDLAFFDDVVRPWVKELGAWKRSGLGTDTGSRVAQALNRVARSPDSDKHRQSLLAAFEAKVRDDPAFKEKLTDPDGWPTAFAYQYSTDDGGPNLRYMFEMLSETASLADEASNLLVNDEQPTALKMKIKLKDMSDLAGELADHIDLSALPRPNPMLRFDDALVTLDEGLPKDLPQSDPIKHSKPLAERKPTGRPSPLVERRPIEVRRKPRTQSMNEKQEARLKKMDPKQNLVLHRRKLREKEARQSTQAMRTAERTGILRSSKSTNRQIRESSASYVPLDASSSSSSDA